MTASDRFSVRRLAAIDLTGKTPRTGRRARLVRVEFTLSTLVGSGLGGWLCALGHPLLGIWSIGVGANYFPLALHALRFRQRPELLEKELRGVDVAAELRRYSLPQLVLAAPFAVGLLAAGETVFVRPGSRQSQSQTEGGLGRDEHGEEVHAGREHR